MINKRKIESFFNKDANDYLKFKYDPDKRSYMSVRHRIMLAFVEKHITNHVPINFQGLDAGCGPGLFLKELLQRKFNVAGFDMSEEMLKISRNNFKDCEIHIGTRLLKADIEAIPFKHNSFDLVSTAGVVEYLSNDDHYLSEFYRILKNGGYLLISITNKYSYNLVFDGIVEYLKRNKFTFNILNKIKNDFLHLGKIKNRDFIIRKHSPCKFKKALKHHKFKIIDSTFFYFNIFPYPFNLTFHKINDFIEIRLEKTGIAKLGFWGEGYLIICKKL